MLLALGIGVRKRRFFLVFGRRSGLFRFTVGFLCLFGSLFPLCLLFGGQLDFPQVRVVVYPQINFRGRRGGLNVSRVMTKFLAEFDHVEVCIEVHLAQRIGVEIVLVVVFILEDRDYAFVSLHRQGKLSSSKGSIPFFLQEPGALHVGEILTR